MRYIAMLALTLVTIFSAQAQTEIEALLYSQQNYGITARGLALGGAFAALGGDVSAIHANPAATAIYRSSEFTISPAFNRYQKRSTFFGETSENSTTRFQMPQMAAVFPGIERTHSGWKHAVGALGYHRTHDFSSEFEFAGISAGSITNRFVERATGFFPDELDPFTEKLAYDIDLIFNPSGDILTEYAGDISVSDRVWKSQHTERSGGIHDVFLSYAANYGDRLYLGGSLHIPFLRLEETSIYREEDQNNQIAFFNSMHYQQEFTVTGAGIQAKLGAIYRFSSMLRASLAYHSPMSIRLNEQFLTHMGASITYEDGSGNSPNNAVSPSGSYSYRFVSPMRVNAGIAAVFGSSGLISLEADFVDYTRARFRFDREGSASDANIERNLNQVISNTYRSVINMRAGGEVVLDNTRLRAGYSFKPDPFRGGLVSINGAEHQVSGGIGMRWDSFFIDAAVAYALTEREYYPYTTEVLIGTDGPQRVSQDISRLRTMLTLGFRF